MSLQEKQIEIRRYLLGTLTEQEKMRKIEERILLDDTFADDLTIAEDDLIEDYLDKNLTKSEEKQFVRFFLSVPERRERLDLIQNLQRYAAEAKTQETLPDSSIPTVEEVEEKENRHGKDDGEKNSFWNSSGWFPMPAASLARYAVVILILGGFIALGFLVWRVTSLPPATTDEVDKGLAHLRKAYLGQRPILSRSTAGFEYAPFAVPRGNSQTTIGVDEAERRRAENYFYNAAEEKSADSVSGSRAHHSFGLLFLADQKFDDALNEFNLALSAASPASSPYAAKIYSDIGAAYLEKALRAKDEDKGDEFYAHATNALQNINRALEIDNSLNEALFNKALVLQKMELENEARAAWAKFLEKDSASLWAAEARKNLELLDRQSLEPKEKSQIYQDFLEAFRRHDDQQAWEISSQTKELITDVMVSQQLARKFLETSDDESRKDEKNEILSAFFYLGGLERAKANDVYFAELAAYYGRTNNTQREALRSAYEEADAGYVALRKPDAKSALANFRRAKDLFVSAGNIWESGIAEFQIAFCLSQNDGLRESNEMLFVLAQTSEKKGYKWLAILANGWLGSNFSNLGEHSKAINFDRQALESAREIGDAYNVQKSLNQLTYEYQKVGNYRQALDFAYQSMTRNSYYLSPRQKFRNLNFVAQALVGAKYYDAAIFFGQENLGLVEREIKNDWQRHSVLIQLGTIYGEIEKFDEASQTFAESLQIARNFPDESKSKQLTARSYLSLANVQRQAGEYDTAIENYNQALGLYEKMEFSVNNYEAQKGRFLCHVAQKDDAAVTTELNDLLRSFDSYRLKLKEEQRNTFFSIEQSVYDAAVDYVQTNLKNSEQAFNYAENSRARSLLNLIRRDESATPDEQQPQSTAPQPLSLAEVRRRFPAQTQMIYYAVLGDKILLWHISAADSSPVIEKPIKQAELENKVSDYTAALINKRDPEKTRRLATELYDLLLAPIESQLAKDKTVCLVADKFLFRLPFASLISPRTGKYLIEEYELLLTPSATVFIDETEIAAKKSTQASYQNEVILSVGDPEFSRRDYPDLENLVAARREAETIAAFYKTSGSGGGGGMIFTGKKAVKKQILAGFSRADVIHFAGHYVPNAKSAALSKLLLANDNSEAENSALSIEEIMRARLLRTRLIVLSACETGVEKFYNGEGIIGAARAFLAAGIPQVVASQWSVDSDASAELMIKFHLYRKRKSMSVSAALRQAQIDLLRDEKSPFRQPFYWAGFLPIGGYAGGGADKI